MAFIIDTLLVRFLQCNWNRNHSLKNVQVRVRVERFRWLMLRVRFSFLVEGQAVVVKVVLILVVIYIVNDYKRPAKWIVHVEISHPPIEVRIHRIRHSIVPLVNSLTYFE